MPQFGGGVKAKNGQSSPGQFSVMIDAGSPLRAVSRDSRIASKRISCSRKPWIIHAVSKVEGGATLLGPTC